MVEISVLRISALILKLSDSFKYTIVHTLNFKYALRLKTILKMIVSNYLNESYLIKMVLCFFRMIVFSIGSVFAIPIIVIGLTNDYLRMRWWLYRGWFVNRININEIRIIKH